MVGERVCGKYLRVTHLTLRQNIFDERAHIQFKTGKMRTVTINAQRTPATIYEYVRDYLNFERFSFAAISSPFNSQNRFMPIVNFMCSIIISKFNESFLRLCNLGSTIERNVTKPKLQILHSNTNDIRREN